MFEIFDEKIEDGPPSFEKHKSTIHPDDAELWQKTVEKCIQDGQPYTIRFRSVFPEKIYYVEAIGQANRDEKGKIISLSGTCQNITDKVLIESELEQQRLKTIHTAKLASLGEVSAGIAHEINNPMAIISSALPLLSKYKDDIEKFNQKIEIIEKAILRVTKIVNGLRRFARTNEVSKKTENALQDILNEALIILEPRARRYFVAIELDCQTEGRIICDPLEIEQVLINIINNAIDAAADSENKKVKIQIVSENKNILLRVFDSGSGVSKAVEAKLFQPFFTTKPVGIGTGLGLSITKGILDTHNAEIRLNRSFQQTCFEVLFERI